jgi:hypothetical protein
MYYSSFQRTLFSIKKIVSAFGFSMKRQSHLIFTLICLLITARSVLCQTIPDVVVTGPALAANVHGRYDSVSTPSSGGVVNAPVVGNGDMALMLGGPAQSLSFCVGKSDFWGVEHGVIMPVGSLLLNIPSLSGSSYSLVENVGAATITGKFMSSTSELSLTSWLAVSQNTAFIQLSNSGSQPLTLSSSLLDGFGTLGNQGTFGFTTNSTWLNVSPDSVNIEIGNHLNVNSTAPLTGRVARVQIFNQALSGAGLDSLGTSDAAGSLLQWAATNTGTATLKGTTTLDASDPYGGSAVFTGDANSEVAVGVMYIPQMQFTVSAWVKLAAINNSRENCIFAALVNNGNPVNYPFLRGLKLVVLPNGALSATLNTSGGLNTSPTGLFTNDAVNAFAATATNPLPINQWIQTAVTYDGNALTIYTNGTPVGITTNFPSVTNLLGWNKTAIHLGDTNVPFNGCAPQGVLMQSVIGAAVTQNTNALTLTVPAGGTATIVLSAVTDRNASNYFLLAQQQTQQATVTSMNNLFQEHNQWWSNFWARSFVRIADQQIQDTWYASLYLLACCSASNSPPPGLWGNFVSSTGMAWEGDYTLDYNYEAPFWAALACNHPELTDNYGQTLLDQVSRGEGIAQHYNHQGIYLYTHLTSLPGWSDDGFTFWSQKSDALFAAVDCAMRWRYTQDTNYAAEIYPYLKGVSDFWDGYLALNNNQYVDTNDAVGESSSTSDVNPATTLAFIQLVYPSLIQISQILNVDVNSRAKWSDVVARLTPLPIVPATSISSLNALGLDYLVPGENVIRDSTSGTAFPTPMVNVYQDHVIRNSSPGMNSTQTIFPGWNIGLESDSVTLAAARSTVRLAAEWFDFNDCCTFYPSAANIGYDPNAILTNLDTLISYYQYPNFMFSLGGGGTEDYSIVPCTIAGMFVQSYQTNLHVFPDWPANQAAAFGNLSACGGFLISSAITNGLVSYVQITSTAGQVLQLMNPWPQTTVQVASTSGPTTQFIGSIFTNQTQVGEILTLTPVNPPVSTPPTPAWFVATANNGNVVLNWTAATAATGYNLERSTSSSGGYVIIATNLPDTSYSDFDVSNNIVYYYEISAVNSLGESTNSTPVSAFPNLIPDQAPVSFASGTFTNDSILTLCGSSAFEASGMSLGDSASQLTTNGYLFSSDPNGGISYNAGGNYTGFLSGGGTTGDAGFDAVLDHGEVGDGGGLLVLNNLSVGTTYNVLFLESDTRGILRGQGQFSVTSGTNISAFQAYAISGGRPFLGGYVLGTFTAATTHQWFLINNTNGNQLNGVLLVNSNTPSTFTSGNFTDDSVLSLAGSPFQELFGVSLGDGTARVTANGYQFGGYPNANVNYSSGETYDGFLNGGGTSGDSAFDIVLNDAELGLSSGTLILSNLAVGVTYNVLFLEADTRSGMGARTFSITTGSLTSPNQSYAYQGGSPSLGGYVLCNFMARGSTQAFINNQGNYGYQLNAILVAKAPANTPAAIVSLNLYGSGVSFTGANGPAGGEYRILNSTNLAMPLSTWLPVSTDYFDANGNFSFSNSVKSNTAASFYRLVSP